MATVSIGLCALQCPGLCEVLCVVIGLVPVRLWLFWMCHIPSLVFEIPTIHCHAERIDCQTQLLPCACDVSNFSHFAISLLLPEQRVAKLCKTGSSAILNTPLLRIDMFCAAPLVTLSLVVLFQMW